MLALYLARAQRGEHSPQADLRVLKVRADAHHEDNNFELELSPLAKLLLRHALALLCPLYARAQRSEHSPQGDCLALDLQKTATLQEPRL